MNFHAFTGTIEFRQHIHGSPESLQLSAFTPFATASSLKFRPVSPNLLLGSYK